MKRLAFALVLFWMTTSFVACAGSTNWVRDLIRDESPILTTMTDASSLVAHVRVTNIWRDPRGANILGNTQAAATCAVQRTLKGASTNGTIRIIFQLPAPPVFEVGHEYIVFVIPKRPVMRPGMLASGTSGTDDYCLVDRWLALAPFSELMLHRVNAYATGNSEWHEPRGAANGSQPIRSETNSTPPAAGSRR